MEKWLFKRTTNKSKTFTHYWSNNGENFPDVSNIENYLSDYLTTNGGDYEWIEVANLRIEKISMDSFKIEIPANELLGNETIFMVLKDDNASNEIDQYFYCDEWHAVSDENYAVISYQATMRLDYWATFGCRMHGYMSSSTMNESFLFLRKMCDRYNFTKDIDGAYTGIGYTIDYKLQPYLMETGSYQYPLIKDNSEKSLSLNEWLYMNSGEQRYKTLEEWLPTWYKWLNSPFAGALNIAGWGPFTSVSTILNYYQNVEARSITDGFNDCDYNSNGKYKWLVLKTGNNSESYLAKNPIFPNMKYIPVVKGEGTDPFAIIPQFTWGGDETREFKWDSLTRTYYIAQTTSESIIQEGQEVPEGKEIIMSFPSTIFGSTRYIKISIVNEGASYANEVYIDNNLAKKLKDVNLDCFSYGIEYAVCNFDEMSVYFNGHFNFKITPYLTFTLNSDGTCTFCFRIYCNSYLSDYTFSIANSNSFKNNIVNLFNTENAYTTKEATTSDKYKLSGEELMLIPIKKGVEGYKFIHNINKDCSGDSSTAMTGNVILSNQEVLGMPINDIPPSVLAMALRNFANEAEVQPIGDRLSIRQCSLGECPLSILEFYSSGTEQTTDGPYETPVLINSLDYVPINIAMSPQLFREYNVIGGTNFFNWFYEVLTNENLSRQNIPEAEPLLHGPAFWQWTYYIDGLHKIILTPDMIDFEKFLFNDWTVKLNVNMTDSTHYKLDISDIKHELYPWTKSTSELISGDIITHPYSTEGWANFLANNQYTQETSKNSKDIDNKWAEISIPYARAQQWLNGIGSGISGAAQVDSIPGAAALIGAGIAQGALGAHLVETGIRNSIKQANEKWNNQWRGQLGNMFSAPTSLNPSGFSNGSLLYSGAVKEKANEYELFRTFTITNIAQKEIWNDISINGYWFKSQATYRSYKNRQKFNMVNCNLNEKDAIVDKYIRENMMNVTTIYSQQQWIEWFKAKCKGGIRLFIDDFDIDDIDSLIKGNIEINYQEPYIPVQLYSICTWNLPKFGTDNELNNTETSTVFPTEGATSKYSIQEYNLVKTSDLTEYNVTIPYSFFNSEEGYAKEDFLNEYQGLRLNCDESELKLFNKDTKILVDEFLYDDPYTSEDIKFSESTNSEYKVIDDTSSYYSKLLTAYSEEEQNYARSNEYVNGWGVTVSLNDNDVSVTAKEFSRFTFPIDITGYSITKKIKNSTDISTRIFDYSTTEWNANQNIMSTSTKQIAAIIVVVPTWSRNSWDLCRMGYTTVNRYHNTHDIGVFEPYVAPELSSWSEVWNSTYNEQYMRTMAKQLEYVNIGSFNKVELNKDENNYVDVTYTDDITISLYNSNENDLETVGSLYTSWNQAINESTKIWFTSSELDSIVNGKERYVIGATYKFGTTNDGGGAVFQIFYKVYWDSENSVFLIDRYTLALGKRWWSEVKPNNSFPPMHMRHMQIVNGQNSVTPSLIVSKYINDTEGLAWAQTNRLNSLIFTKKSAFGTNEQVSYVLNKKEGR